MLLIAHKQHADDQSVEHTDSGHDKLRAANKNCDVAQNKRGLSPVVTLKRLLGLIDRHERLFKFVFVESTKALIFFLCSSFEFFY